MKLVVFSHKPCWPSAQSPSGYATDGGFPMQMQALAELFDSTRVVVPCAPARNPTGEIPLRGPNLSVVPLRPPSGSGVRRKAGLPLWLLGNGPVLLREAWAADAIHTPIPGDIGTFGMLLALALRKPLFVRHCGNWFVQKTRAERFWKWSMERLAGGRNVMLTTGGAPEPPSRRNAHLRWIFSTSLSEQELNDCAMARRRPEPGQARLIIVCRQDVKKGTGVVIESLPLIRTRFPGVTLSVVGDGPDLPRFQALAVQLEVQDRVTFHGKVDHDGVIGLLRQADLFCYPTAASEGFPKVVLEALACGLPVVTTPVSVLPQLIRSGSGLLLPERSAPAVAAAVAGILGDSERYGRFSAGALAAASQYSLEAWRTAIGSYLTAGWGPLRAYAQP